MRTSRVGGGNRPGWSRRLGVSLGVTGLIVGVLATGAVADGWFGTSDNPWPYAPAGRAPVLAAVGDIACQPGSPVEKEKQTDVCDTTGQGDTTRNQAQTSTANRIEEMRPNLVAILGDEQYQVGRYEDFMGSFDHTYGAFKFLQRPTPGNHEFYTSHGETGVGGYGYFDYYNGYQLNPDGTPVTHGFTTGTGTGFTVMGVLRAVEKVTGKSVPYQIAARREGDPAELVADSTRLRHALGWTPVRSDLATIVKDAWEFHRRKAGKCS